MMVKCHNPRIKRILTRLIQTLLLSLVTKRLNGQINNKINKRTNPTSKSLQVTLVSKNHITLLLKTVCLKLKSCYAKT
jgi:hypothetical protein